MKKPLLITTLGFPGSGKTYFSERLCKKEKFFHLNSDKTRFTLFKEPKFTKEETDGVFRLMDLLAEELLAVGVSVVYDANMNFRVHRKRLQKLAERCDTTYVLLWIQTDVEIAEKRLIKRGTTKGKRAKLLYRPLDIKWLHHYKKEIEEPRGAERFIMIDCNADFKNQFRQFKRSIKLIK
jgi:predicted kinase